MKKSLVFLSVIVTAVALCASSVTAGFHVGINAGYAYSSMAELNNSLIKMRDAVTATAQVTVGDFGSAVYGNLDIDIDGDEWIAYGVRAGAQYVLPTEIEVVDSLITTTEAYSALLVPAMGGVIVKAKLPMDIIISANAYAGYGFAFVTKGVTVVTSLYTAPVYTSFYQGGGFMAEGGASLDIPLGDIISLSAHLSYRQAKFDNLKSTNKIEVAGYTVVDAGDLFEVNPDDAIPADFSGINAGVGVNIRF